MKVGRYEVLEEIGRGTAGVVYRAHGPDLDRTVAVKAIEIGFPVTEAERRSFEARFFDEARVAARLSHPGIVAVHDVGRDEGTGALYVAFEYLRGRPLAATL